MTQYASAEIVNSKGGKIILGLISSFGVKQFVIGEQKFELDEKSAGILTKYGINNTQIASLGKILELKKLYNGVLFESGYYHPIEHGNIEIVGKSNDMDMKKLATNYDTKQSAAVDKKEDVGDDNVEDEDEEEDDMLKEDEEDEEEEEEQQECVDGDDM